MKQKSYKAGIGRCKDCGKETSLSHNFLCKNCGEARMKEALNQRRRREGKIYEKWKNATILMLRNRMIIRNIMKKGREK